MAFRRKAPAILAHNPDILVVVECEHPDHLVFDENIPQPKDVLWFGKNRHKGLAVFSYTKYRFRAVDWHNESYKMIIPIKVTGGKKPFTLFLVWAHNPDDKDGRYITQVWKALAHYNARMNRSRAILIGDFNSNSIWDHQKTKLGSHGEVVQILARKKIFSTYHLHFNQQQGREEHPTFYLYRHADKPYHLDYCFASSELLDKMVAVEIGAFDVWTKYSDHVPIIVTFADI